MKRQYGIDEKRRREPKASNPHWLIIALLIPVAILASVLTIREAVKFFDREESPGFQSVYAPGAWDNQRRR
jgi:hypothetical protein